MGEDSDINFLTPSAVFFALAAMSPLAAAYLLAAFGQFDWPLVLWIAVLSIVVALIDTFTPAEPPVILDVLGEISAAAVIAAAALLMLWLTPDWLDAAAARFELSLLVLVVVVSLYVLLFPWAVFGSFWLINAIVVLLKA